MLCPHCCEVQPVRPIELSTGTLFIETAGRKFEVKFICTDIEVANTFLAKHTEVAMLAQDDNGLIYLADIKAASK